MSAKRILIVDDDPDVLESMSFLVMHLGHAVETSTNGQDALRKVATCGDFAAVLVDFKMPGMDGPALAKEIKARCPTLPIVLVTGSVPDKCAPDIACVLNKPFLLSDLGAVIARLA
jgi:two-component system, NtrC family, response regulator GlrR